VKIVRQVMALVWGSLFTSTVINENWHSTAKCQAQIALLVQLCKLQTVFHYYLKKLAKSNSRNSRMTAKSASLSQKSEKT
jgi:hypothetical protein